MTLIFCAHRLLAKMKVHTISRTKMRLVLIPKFSSNAFALPGGLYRLQLKQNAGDLKQPGFRSLIAAGRGSR